MSSICPTEHVRWKLIKGSFITGKKTDNYGIVTKSAQSRANLGGCRHREHRHDQRGRDWMLLCKYDPLVFLNIPIVMIMPSTALPPDGQLDVPEHYSAMQFVRRTLKAALELRHHEPGYAATPACACRFPCTKMGRAQPAQFTSRGRKLLRQRQKIFDRGEAASCILPAYAIANYKGASRTAHNGIPGERIIDWERST